MSKVYITIDQRALAHNFAQIKRITQYRPIWAMIKANAYGHGSVQVAQTLPNAAAFGVASLEEALILREGSIKQSIILMQGVYSFSELRQAILAKLDLVIHDAEQIKLLHRVNHQAGLKVWLKIDTGMNRLGFKGSAAITAYNALQNCPALEYPLGIMTHLAEADDLTSMGTMDQLARFAHITHNMLGPKSIANSAGILHWPDSHADWVRPGLILYGVSPSMQSLGMKYDLKPVMTLSSQLAAIKQVKKGEFVGYGGTWQAPQDTCIGIVPIGYADGYPQLAPYGTPVAINGVYCSIVGRVSMDMLTIDLSHNPSAKVGDQVVLWGADLPVEIIAKSCNMSSYELLSRVATSKRSRVCWID